MMVEKRLVPRRGRARALPSPAPALPSACGIAVARRSSRWRWEEQSRCALHTRSMANGFAVFMDFVS